MKSIFTALTIAFFINTLHAQPITGDWYGALDIQGNKLHLVFHISAKENGLATTMDSPDQGAKGIAMDSTAYAANVLVVTMKAAKMRYTGTYDEANTQIKGEFEQAGHKLPMVLTRTKEETKPIVRPQEPVDFPYTQEEVTFTNTKDNVTLAGTLTLPKDKKADKIVVLISGSGPQNRDEEVKQFHHKPFLVLSDWLTRHGIAVLRYDDRGIGSSTGSFKSATSADFANDAEAAVDFILSRSDLKGMKVGLIGHSEGGMIAPMVAARNKKVKFIVLLAGPGAPIDELMLMQSQKIQELENTPRNIEDLNLGLQRKAYTYLKRHKDDPTETVMPVLKKLIEEEIAKYPAEAMQGADADEMVSQEISTFTSPWFRYFVTYVPEDNLSKLKCPVLAMNGTLDMQVIASQNLPAIEAALKKAKNKHYEIVPMEGLNHLMQKAPTGNPNEYGQIEETINQAALDKITEWVNKQ